MKKKNSIIILSTIIVIIFLTIIGIKYLGNGDIAINNETISESYLKCINETIIPYEYIEGKVLILLNQTVSEEEANDFNRKYKLDKNITVSHYYYEIRDHYNVGWPVEGRDERAWELGGKPAQEFSNYLNSSIFVERTQFSYNWVNSLIIVHFYKNVSIDEAERFIKGYEKSENFDSFKFFGRINPGELNIPNGTEIDWICKLKEEDIVDQVAVGEKWEYPSGPEVTPRLS